MTEVRRLALELAIRLHLGATVDEGVLETAAKFEKFLLGAEPVFHEAGRTSASAFWSAFRKATP